MQETRNMYSVQVQFSVPLNYLILPVHTTAEGSHNFPIFIYGCSLHPRSWMKLCLQLQQAEGLHSKGAQTNFGWRNSSLPGMSWSHSAWQIALNPSSCGWAQSGVLNWHLQQAWRLAPVSRSICCTAIRLHLCTRWTCVSWITFKLIWGLCWSDSRSDEAWRKP